MKLAGKTAIVTGGGGGIGRAVSLRYAQEGARCAVADRKLSLAEAVAKEIQVAGGSALAISLDVTKQKDIDQTIQALPRPLVKSIFFSIMQESLRWLHYWIPLGKAMIGSLMLTSRACSS